MESSLSSKGVQPFQAVIEATAGHEWLFKLLEPLAVVVSLFYVAHQIRQNTSAVRSATAQAVHENYVSWYHLLVGDSQLSQITVNGLRDYAALSEMEKARFIVTFMAYLSYSQNAFIKWREGSLSPPLSMGWELVIMNLFLSPGGKAFWKERAYLFGDDFRRYIETEIMTRKPHPEVKPMGAFSIGDRAG